MVDKQYISIFELVDDLTLYKNISIQILNPGCGSGAKTIAHQSIS